MPSTYSNPPPPPNGITNNELIRGCRDQHSWLETKINFLLHIAVAGQYQYLSLINHITIANKFTNFEELSAKTKNPEHQLLDQKNS